MHAIWSLTASTSRGPRVSRKWDRDGNEYVDYAGGHGALLLGHGRPEVLAAIQDALPDGTHPGANHEREVRWAQIVRELVPCAERVRFTSSGTEATHMALRLARAHTGKNKIVRLQGSLPRLARSHDLRLYFALRRGADGGRAARPRSPGDPAAARRSRSHARRLRGRRRYRGGDPGADRRLLRPRAPCAGVSPLPAGADGTARRGADLRRGGHRVPRRPPAERRGISASPPT